MVGEEENTIHKLDFEETELRLGLSCGRKKVQHDNDTTNVNGKRGFVDLKLNISSHDINNKNTQLEFKNNSSLKTQVAKTQVVGWPPVRSSRKNILISQKIIGHQENDKIGNGVLVKVSMDGAPYLRKVDLNMYKSYQELFDALAKMFSSFTIVQGMKDFMNERKLMDLLNSSDYVSTYQDKDGDWMLVGDVPWGMFVDSCKRLRIMKGIEAIGLVGSICVFASGINDGYCAIIHTSPTTTPEPATRRPLWAAAHSADCGLSGSDHSSEFRLFMQTYA